MVSVDQRRGRLHAPAAAAAQDGLSVSSRAWIVSTLFPPKFPFPWVAPISVDYTPASLRRPGPPGNQQVYPLSNWSLIIIFILENVNKCTIQSELGTVEHYNNFLLTSHSWGYWILRRVAATCHLLVMYTILYPLLYSHHCQGWRGRQSDNEKHNRASVAGTLSVRSTVHLLIFPFGKNLRIEILVFL